MKCESCGTESEDRYCKKCGDILDEVVRTIGEKRWAAMDDCAFIYPYVLRVANGELMVHDIIQVRFCHFPQYSFIFNNIC